MDYQNFDPNQNQENMRSKLPIIIVAGLIVVAGIVFGFFSISKLDANLTTVKRQNLNLAKTDNTKQEPVVVTKEVDVDGSHETVGTETTATQQEKKTLGVPDFSNIKVLRRDIDGNIISFEIVINPNDPDSDKDGLTDSEEKRLGTDSNKIDSDGDGISDFQELTMGTDPVAANNFSKK